VKAYSYIAYLSPGPAATLSTSSPAIFLDISLSVTHDAGAFLAAAVCGGQWSGQICLGGHEFRMA